MVNLHIDETHEEEEKRVWVEKLTYLSVFCSIYLQNISWNYSTETKMNGPKCKCRELQASEAYF